MRVLITGSTGFIGSQLSRALRTHGHEIVEVSRSTGVDFQHACDPAAWIPFLKDVDVVVNAVGILRERRQQTFEAVHHQGPVALFQACVASAVAHVVQISALGAAEGTTDYFRSKHAADQFLLSQPIAATIVQPSLVYGAGGGSATLFDSLAVMPIVVLPGDGGQRVQPVHIDDVVDGLVRLIEQECPPQSVMPFAGPEQLTLRQWLDSLRRQLGLPAAWFVRIPLVLVRIGAWLGQWRRNGLLEPQTLSMLEAGNVGSAEPLRQLIGRELKPPSRFVPSGSAHAQRNAAQLAWLVPLLKLSIALVWLWTAAVSFGLYPLERSRQLVIATGLDPSLASAAVFAGALVDLLLGIATLFLTYRWLWLLQLIVIATYTAILSATLPQFWLHPFGPLAKNLPMMAMLVMLYALSRRPR